jgi:hypothetical protein
MFTKILKVLFVTTCLVLLFYISLPNFTFPKPLPDSLQSTEPADLETPLRRGYFTNYTRAQVISWYESQFDHSSFLNIKLPTLLLNYPPEDAQTLIRDQTSSTFLQELVHPLRESIYINGFEPPSYDNKPVFNVGGKYWRQKIIIKMVPTSIFVRIAVFGAEVFCMVVLFKGFRETFIQLWHKKK